MIRIGKLLGFTAAFFLFASVLFLTAARQSYILAIAITSVVSGIGYSLRRILA